MNTNYELLEKVLEKGKEIVKEEKFGTVIRGQQRDVLIKFVEEFSEEKKSSKKDMEVAERILKIAKGYYTYSDSSESSFTSYFLKDKHYDALLASFKQKGGEEPLPFIPDSLKKVEPADESLTNFNMARAYRVYDAEPVPNGVAEKESVESLVKEIYKEAGLSKGDKTRILIAPKIDGVALSTSINKGKFELPTQKGQKEGKAVLVRGLKGFKLKDPAWNKCNVQYEIFITSEQRKNLAKEFATEYKNNRNTVAGLVTRLAGSDDDEMKEIILKNIYMYPIIATDTDEGDNWKKVIEKIDSMGILPKDMIERVMFEGNREEIIDQVKDYYQKVEGKRESLSYAIDGIVVTFLDKEVRKELGRKDGANRFQFAFKFNPYSARVEITNIYLSSGKLGERTPMVSFKPTIIDGREFTEAAFDTHDDMRKFALSVGDEILLVIAGDVIPKITMDEHCKRAAHRNPVTKFTHCGSCHTLLADSDKKYRCENPNCIDNIVGRFAHFFEKIGIEYGVSTAQDIYRLTQSGYISSILKVTEKDLESIGYKSKATKFVKEFRAAVKKLNEYELLGYMGISKLQKKTARKIIEKIPLQKLLSMTDIQMEVALRDIDGIGRNLASSYVKNIKRFSNDLNYLIKEISKEPVDFSKIKIVGFTGLTPDDKLTEMIKAKGWDTTDGNKFDYLVTASYNRTGKKMNTANDKGIKVFTREDFIEMLNSKGNDK